jgi:hypothetical protein
MLLNHCGCLACWNSVISDAGQLVQETLQLAPYVWWVGLQHIKVKERCCISIKAWKLRVASVA